MVMIGLKMFLLLVISLATFINSFVSDMSSTYISITLVCGSLPKYDKKSISFRYALLPILINFEKPIFFPLV